MAWKWLWEREDPGPLREIVLSGYYYAEDEMELEKSEKEYRRWGWLEEDESLKDKDPHTKIGKERFVSLRISYCHKKTRPEERDKFIVDPKLRNPKLETPKLRARLYDEEWNFLTEDNLWSYEYETGANFGWGVESYIPYHPAAFYLRVVRLVEDKEVVLREIRISNLEWLQSGGSSYTYRNRSDCYRAP